jgi:hypothetical protein
MATSDIQFGEWLPSQPDFRNPGCVVADNVIPSPGGYRAFPAAVGSGDTVTGAVFGAEQFFDNSRNGFIVGGAGTRLFTYRSGTVTETAGYTLPATGWDFCRFNDFLIAAETNNAPQYLTDIDTDDTFSALTGSPPTASCCATVGQFVILGNISGSPSRIQWSAYNNPAGSWAASRLTQAGFADLDTELGPVQRIVGGRFGLVFQQRGIQRLSYVGPPTVWRADPVSKDRGTIAPFSVVNAGYKVYFLAQDGFYVTDGSSFEPIGGSRVNRWFFDAVDQDAISTVQGAVDWQNESVVWAYREKGETARNRLLIYSWAQNRWSTATVDTGWIVTSSLEGITLEDLDALYGTLESVPYSLDSDEWRGIAQRLNAFVTGTTTSEFNKFTGAPLEATFETGEFQPAPGRRVFVSGVTPVMDAEAWDAEAQLIMKDNRNAETFSGKKAAGWDGSCPVRGEGKMMRVQLIKPAGTEWVDAQGVQIEYQMAGMR